MADQPVPSSKDPGKAAYDIPALLSAINDLGQGFTEPQGRSGDTSRKALLSKAHELCYALETPAEATTRIAWANPTLDIAIKVSINLGIFGLLKKRAEAGDVTGSRVISGFTGAEHTLVVRIMKQLAALGVIFEVDADQYAPTPFALGLTEPRYRDGILFFAEGVARSYASLPTYLKMTGYKDPKDLLNGPYQFGYQTEMTFFKHIAQNPTTLEHFGNHMLGYSQGRPKWWEPGSYPVRERLVEGLHSEPESILLVDVGGSQGNDLAAFIVNHEGLPGRLICQDLPQVIGGAKSPHPRVELMEHDFFTEQPVRGARAYYLHSILHSWPDEKCREILLKLKKAMKPGYSKLLLDEYVVPSRDAHWAITSLDLIMMTLFASRERSETQWRELLESVGLQMTGIWTPSPGTESLIEAVVS